MERVVIYLCNIIILCIRCTISLWLWPGTWKSCLAFCLVHCLTRVSVYIFMLCKKDMQQLYFISGLMIGYLQHEFWLVTFQNVTNKSLVSRTKTKENCIYVRRYKYLCIYMPIELFTHIYVHINTVYISVCAGTVFGSKTYMISKWYDVNKSLKKF